MPPPVNHPPYEQPTSFTFLLRGQDVPFISKPGLPNWDRVTPGALLLSERIEIPKNAKTLFLGCGHGAVLVPIAEDSATREVWYSDLNYIAMLMFLR